MTNALITAIFAVFGDVGAWIIEQLGLIPELFWNSTESSLTFLGVLSLISLGISVIFLMIRVVQNFLHFRG